MRVENILQNYDEFNHLKALQAIDINNPEAVEEFKKAHFVTDEDIAAMQKLNYSKKGQFRITVLPTMIYVTG